MEFRLCRTRNGTSFVANFSPEMDVLLRNGTVRMQFDYDEEIFDDGLNSEDVDDETLDGSGESMADWPSEEEDDDLSQYFGDDYQIDNEMSIISISDELSEEEDEVLFEFTDEHEFDSMMTTGSTFDVSFNMTFAVRHDTDSDSNFWNNWSSNHTNRSVPIPPA